MLFGHVKALVLDAYKEHVDLLVLGIHITATGKCDKAVSKLGSVAKEGLSTITLVNVL